MKKISFSKQIILASILGLIAGLVFKENMKYVSFIGDIFLRLIQMSVVFLVLTAIIESVGSIEIGDLGKIGLKALSLFAVTTIYSAFIGMVVVNVIKPGQGVQGIEPAVIDGEVFNFSIPELITSFFPKNIIQSMSEGNMIHIIVFGIFFGLAISVLQKNESAQRIYVMVVDFGKVIMQIIKFVMRFAPIGVFALLGSITGSIGVSVILPLIKYLAAMLIATVLIFSTHLAIVSFYGKINPFRIITKIKDTIIVSVTTTSSAISLPVQMNDCENKLGISPRISKLVNSLAMSLNSDGLAMTISISCIMIAQFYGITLSFQQQIVIVAVSTLSTLGNLLVPGGALVAISIALSMTGLPVAGVALIAGVDWFAGIARTLLNVIDDVLCTLFVAISEKEFNRDIFDRDQKE
ncbi:MAG: dicarboxylate/amino acid:cation symporter [Clostridiaceae bacterium]